MLLALAGCVLVHDCPHCDDDLDCADIAIRDAAGNPDSCDVAACDACADQCGDDCAVLESFPPQYACPGASWDVYDFCPDWSFPSAIHAEDVQDLGCGDPSDQETLTAVSAVAGRIDVTHLDYASGCCPEAVQVEVEVLGRTLDVSYTLVNDFCDCICELDTSYTLVGVDGGPWTVRAGAVEATVEVPF
jgi:hypothetical protein